MLRIHFENRCIAICSPQDPIVSDPEALVISDCSTKEITSLPDFFDRHRDISRIVMPTDHIDTVFDLICKQFKEIYAGGGLVSDRKGDYLLILRNGLWDLPKGKLEQGETIEECALREVNEETGLHPLSLGKLLCVTHHTYHMFGEFCLKHTYWYSMDYASNENPVPQTEENISRAIWASEESLPKYLAGTYTSIKEVFSHR